MYDGRKDRHALKFVFFKICKPNSLCTLTCCVPFTTLIYCIWEDNFLDCLLLLFQENFSEKFFWQERNYHTTQCSKTLANVNKKVKYFRMWWQRVSWDTPPLKLYLKMHLRTGRNFLKCKNNLSLNSRA